MVSQYFMGFLLVHLSVTNINKLRLRNPNNMNILKEDNYMIKHGKIMKYIMKRFLFSLILLFPISSFADSMCSFYKGLGTAQEEHYVGFHSNWRTAVQIAFNKCIDDWGKATCEGYRFSHYCNTVGWGCAYRKSLGTAQEESYPGFGATREEARLGALSRCVDDWGRSTCIGYRFTLKCVEEPID